jgi:hypothetical protein
MIKWYINKNNAMEWLGYAEDRLVYRVFYTNFVGWNWEPTEYWDPDCCSLARELEDEAMDEAEAHFRKRLEMEGHLTAIDLEISLKETREIESIEEAIAS